jgi:Mg-chelatase subunit ChlD
MNDDPDKPLNPVGDDALEARLTAWVLGEASPFEAAELEEICARNPEARLFERRLRVLHGFIAADRKAGPEDDWKLPAEKRAKIEALFEEPVVEVKPDPEPEKIMSIRRTGRRALMALAACTVISVAGWAIFSSISESSKGTLAMSTEAFSEPGVTSREAQEAALVELRKAVAVQEDAVEDKRKLLSQIIRTEGVIYSGDSNAFQGSRGFNEADDAESAARAYTKVEQEKIQLESQIEALSKYDGEQLANYASGLNLPDDNITPILKPQLELAKRERESLRLKGLTDSAPEVRRQDELIKGMEKDVGEAAANLRETLAAKLALSKEQLARLEKRVDSKVDDAIRRGVANQSFVDAKGDFERSQRELERLKLQLISEEMRLKGADGALALNEVPASPQVPMKKPVTSYGHLSSNSAFTTKPQLAAQAAEPAAGTTIIAGKDFENLDAMGRLAEATAADNAPKVVPFLGGDSSGMAGLAGGRSYAFKSSEVDPFASGGAALDDSLDLYADSATGGLKRDITLEYQSAQSPGQSVLGLDALQAQKADPETAEGEAAQAWFSQSEGTKSRFAAPPAAAVRQNQEARSKNELTELTDKPAEPEGAPVDAKPLAESAVELAANDQTRSQLLAEVDQAWDVPVPPAAEDASKALADLDEAKESVSSGLKEAAKPEELVPQLEEVNAKLPKQKGIPVPQAETLTSAEPFSTFSLHVSDASFKLAKAALDRGEVPAADRIRPEEFYNAFDYGDPAPGHGEPVACAVEQSAHPAIPQRNLLRIGVKTGSQGRGGSTPLNLTLLLDSSGSMEREDRTAGLANAVKQLSGLLKEGDTISVIGFARQPRLLADRLPGARAQELNAILARTPSEGGTNLEEGLKLGEELALRQFNPAAQNRIVLFTDGAANLGDAMPETLQAKVEQMRQQGIAFDAAGFGADGLNDQLLERLTRNGNGRYYVVDDAADADANFAKQLAGAFRPAAENVKVQVRFNPARVAKYKLIGFEEHRLNKEDFRNDAVDAAEMAAEEAGNALYQIEALPQGEGEVGEVSVRFRDAASGQMVERTWTIPYEAQAPAFDQAKPSLQLAGLAAFAAEKLRAAPLADAVDFQQLAPVLAKVKVRYPNSRPVAELEAMIGKLK